MEHSTRMIIKYNKENFLIKPKWYKIAYWQNLFCFILFCNYYVFTYAHLLINSLILKLPYWRDVKQKFVNANIRVHGMVHRMIVKYNKDNFLVKTIFSPSYRSYHDSDKRYTLFTRIVCEIFFCWRTSARWITSSLSFLDPPYINQWRVSAKRSVFNLSIRGDCLLFQALKTLLGRLYIMQEEEVWKFTGVSVSFVIWGEEKSRGGEEEGEVSQRQLFHGTRGLTWNGRSSEQWS